MIYIYVRKSPDWTNYTVDDVLRENPIREFVSNPEEASRWLVDRMSHWDSTYSTSFFKFRHKMNLIAKSNWRAEVVYSFDPDKYNDNDLIIPTDDDDWFRPDIAEVLESQSEEFDVIYWNSVVCDTCKNSVELWSWFNNNYIMGTNGYAVRARILKQLSARDCWLVLQRHGTVMSYINKFPARIMGMLDQHLSCYNVHLATTTNLFHHRSPFRIPDDLESYQIAKKFQWIEKWFNDMRQTTLNLRKRVTCL